MYLALPLRGSPTSCSSIFPVSHHRRSGIVYIRFKVILNSGCTVIEGQRFRVGRNHKKGEFRREYESHQLTVLVGVVAFVVIVGIVAFLLGPKAAQPNASPEVRSAVRPRG
jgi:hypothetical protein